MKKMKNKIESDMKIGSKVRIEPKNVNRGNLKRNEWIEKNKERVFTVEQGVLLNGKQTSITIFQLKEDDSEIKWLFTVKELKRVN